MKFKKLLLISVLPLAVLPLVAVSSINKDHNKNTETNELIKFSEKETQNNSSSFSNDFKKENSSNYGFVNYLQSLDLTEREDGSDDGDSGDNDSGEHGNGDNNFGGDDFSYAPQWKVDPYIGLDPGGDGIDWSKDKNKYDQKVGVLDAFRNNYKTSVYQKYYDQIGLSRNDIKEKTLIQLASANNPRKSVYVVEVGGDPYVESGLIEGDKLNIIKSKGAKSLHASVVSSFISGKNGINPELTVNNVYNNDSLVSALRSVNLSSNISTVVNYSAGTILNTSAVKNIVESKKDSQVKDKEIQNLVDELYKFEKVADTDNYLYNHKNLVAVISASNYYHEKLTSDVNATKFDYSFNFKSYENNKEVTKKVTFELNKEYALRYGELRSQALSRNGIIVGAYDILNSNNSAYFTQSSGQFDYRNYITVSAPGDGLTVGVVNEDSLYELYDVDGTSFSAPIVSGVLVELQQRLNQKKMDSYQSILSKSILISSAVHHSSSYKNKNLVNYNSENVYDNRLGFGSVNYNKVLKAVDSTSLIKAYNKPTYEHKISLKQGERANVSLVWEENPSNRGEDYNLEIFDKFNRQIVSSKLKNWNIEYASFKATYSGEFKIKITSNSSIISPLALSVSKE